MTAASNRRVFLRRYALAVTGIWLAGCGRVPLTSAPLPSVPLPKVQTPVQEATPMTPYRLYIGTYTIWPGQETRTEGIFLATMDPDTGRVTIERGFDAGPNPSFLTLSRDRRHLFAVNERTQGGTSAFAVDAASGTLTPLNSQPVQGADPCYLTLDPTGRWLLVACYSSGNLVTLPVQADGSLGALVEHIQHVGTGPNTARQEKAHAHSVRFDPSQTFALAADLGMDRVWVYRLDAQTGKMSANTPPGLDGEPGAGPRHLEFHPNGRFLYIANELGSSVTACAWDGQAGKITSFQTLSTLPQGFSGENLVADIHITPSGEYLYVSNRGHNSLAGFRVDAAAGSLSALGATSCGGNFPRNFAIDPAGKFLLCANQYSGDLVTFKLGADGSLTPTGDKLALASPVCVLFV